MNTDSVCMNKWEGKDAVYDSMAGAFMPSRAMRRAIFRRRARREHVRGGGAVRLGLTVELPAKGARRVMWGKALESLLPYLVALLLASGGLWLLRGHDEGADRAAGRIEQVEALRIRGGVQ